MPRVLITDAEGRATLAACRDLRSSGYEVDAVASRGPAAAQWSLSCSRRLRAPDPRVDRAAFVESLHVLLEERNYDVLLPGSDAALHAISEHRDRLSPLVALGLPPHEVVIRALSKTTAVEACSHTRLAAPPTEIANSLDEARVAASEHGFPLIVKPSTSVRPDGPGLRQRSSRLVRDDQELAATVEDFGLPVLIQRRLRGSVHSLGGVFAAGGLLAAAHSRYERTWPPEAGNVSCSVSLPVPDGLREDAIELLGGLGWRGIFELELLADDDGGFAMIDLNPRIYGSLALAVHADAALPTIWCETLLGDVGEVHFRDARGGVWYRWEDAEARNALLCLRSGRIGELLGVLKPHRHTVHAQFRLRDPAPIAARAISVIRTRRTNGGPARSVRTRA
jgi:predicted ATP-grasp superfamily ATP-dependent carboligase